MCENVQTIKNKGSKRDLPKPSGGKGSVWLASCPFACGEEEEEGLSDSVLEDEGDCRESEGEGVLRIPCANNSHRVRGPCIPFLCRLSPCTRASPWGSTDLSKWLQRFTSTWPGKSRLRCSWYEVHVGGVKWGQRAIWGGGLARTQMISKKNRAVTGKIIRESSGTNSCSWCLNYSTAMYKKKNPRLQFFLVLPTTSKSESIGAIHWESMAFQNRSMSLSAFRMAYWQHQRAIQTFLLARVLSAPSTAALGPARLKEPPITLAISIACDELLSVQ